MPLSEHEQHLLEQMEQALYAEDPKFASQMQGSTGARPSATPHHVGVLAVVAGLVLVVLGVVNEAVWLGAIGFALMVGGAAYAVTPPTEPQADPRCRRPATARSAPTPRPRAGGRSGRAAKGRQAAPERLGRVHAAHGGALGQAPRRRLELTSLTRLAPSRSLSPHRTRPDGARSVPASPYRRRAGVYARRGGRVPAHWRLSGSAAPR